MTLQDIENYILSKPNAVKTMIPHWKYIRYTVYSVAFVTLTETTKGIILTVLGKFPQYEEEYEKIVIPSVDNDPKYFSSIVLSGKNVPDRVIKSVIDYSYKRRVQAIPMPENAGNGGDIPYCGIVSAVNGHNPLHSEGDSASEVTATTRSHRYGITKTLIYPKTELEGRGKWDTLPYVAATNAATIESFLHTVNNEEGKGKADKDAAKCEKHNRKS